MDAEAVGVGRRRRRSVAEKLQIVHLTLEPGSSVAEVGRAHGVNANQLFKWRRQFERGQLGNAHFVLALISAGFPWLVGIVVLVIAFRMAGPIEVKVLVVGRSGKRPAKKRESG